MMLRQNSDRDTNEANCKKMNTDCSWRPWSELPSDLLDVISRQLHMMDHLSFSGVCRSWRASALPCKKDKIASQPPFLVALSAHVRGRLFFYDIFEGRKYKTEFPNHADKFCCGFCCGYLMMEDRNAQNGLWLVNPFTRHELQFPAPPERIRHAIITSSVVPSDSSIVALSADYENLLFCHPGYVNWIVLPVPSKSWVYLDLTIFKKKIYALTSQGKVWEVNPNSNFPLTPVAFRRVPYLDHMGLGRKFGFLCPTLHLVASEEELLMVNLIPHEEPQVFKLDFKMKEWVKMESLEDKVMFLSDVKCGVVGNPDKWGGCSNSIYSVNLFSNMCIAISMEGHWLGSCRFPGSQFVGGSPSSSPYWFFQESYNTDALSDN
ncbi:hypothetical protein AAG906_023157 [Vitis piasezkii]